MEEASSRLEIMEKKLGAGKTTELPATVGISGRE